MVSNNHPTHQPLQSNPASSGTSQSARVGSSSVGGGGLGRSAPIRTLPQISGGLAPPLAVPQHGLAHSVASKSSKPGSSHAASTEVRSQAKAAQPAGDHATASPVSPPPTSSPKQLPHDKHTTKPSSQASTQRSTEQLQPHIVTLPPPQQTQIHPLGSPQQPPNLNTQPAPSHQTHTQTVQAKSPPQNQQQVSSPSKHLTPLSPLPQLTSPPHKIQQQFQPSRKPATPDEEVDAFLLNTLYDGTNQSPNKLSDPSSKIRPPPLPQTENILAKAKLLAMRRAWGDVIRVTNDALIVKNMDGSQNREGVTHHDIYSELIAAATSSSSIQTESSASDETLDRLRSETCELITLRFISHLKLRRYVDLGKEVTQLGLIPHLPPHPSSIASTSEVTSVPPSPGTEVVPLSSVPSNSNAVITQSLSWKEGSIHSSDAQDKLPSWIPYGLRILAAQQLQYTDGSSKAIDVLYDMRDRAIRTDYWSSAGMEVWCSTIDNALVNAFVRKKEWRLALGTLEDMLNGLEEGVEREVEWWCRLGGHVVDPGTRRLMKELMTSSAEVELMSRQILILLQVGALDAAESVQSDLANQVTRIKAITRSSNKNSLLLQIERESALVRHAPLRLKINEGLLLFSRCNFTDASTCFRDALLGQKGFDKTLANLTTQPPGCPSWKDLSSPTLGFETESSLTVECLNNLSLCLLYSGNMRCAVQEMEGLVREDPTMYLTEGMAFNLCTLYELGSDGEECTRRKKILQRVAKRFFLHDVGVESFRLN
ncbi:hypothetical protein HJC23_002698 [Cyclotella cryptica]|uniref:Uncharacterized protein n=1 Tax=Cyclotella cryptica TaxID=29204 RepID=A0ABD3PAS9_9STRA|eukprot:CCRYP_016032-RA/>CCRYP_016032-RA protein AED:0.00 eAED:0.00 QI:354/-1/1/1/-1/1/1/164/765